MTNRYAIKMVWNRERELTAIDGLRLPGWRHRRRGRGHRHGYTPYHQSIPAYLASHFTVYGEPGPALDCDKFGSDWEILQYELVRIEPNGKPRLRPLRHTFTC